MSSLELYQEYLLSWIGTSSKTNRGKIAHCKSYFNLQLVKGVSVQLYFGQYLQVLVSGLVYKVHIIINKNTSTMYTA